ncbi:MAG TPA: EcsC family protein [Acidimicrobiia bacterium]|nr:EcsC family protein [Acidimicrobiia bacterium]
MERPEERLFALGVLSVGTAAQAGKAAAYIELNKVVQNLARNVTWKVLDKSAVTKVVKGAYARLGMNLTKRKLGQAVPVVGIVLGAGLNARLINRVADDAGRIYRERFLRERYGLVTTDVELAEGGAEETVKLTEIIEAEVVATRSPAS